jgi:hypothetical protein
VRGESIIKQVSTHLPGTMEERRGFQYFVTSTAVELSGYFDSSFWEQLILQASVAEPALRHAVIGLGALHEDFSNRYLDMATKCDAARTGFGFATGQYTKAIGHLRRSLSSRQQKPLTALMSCIMFVCFESLRGHFSSAIIHLQSGLKILHNSHLKSSPRDEEMIEDHIAPIFMRLCIQAVLYIDTRSEADRTAFALSIMTISRRKNVIAEEFPDLETARRSLYQITEGLFSVFYMCDGSIPMVQQPAEAMILYEQYRHELSQWIIGFENLMKHKSLKFNSKQLRGAAICKLHYIVVNIMAKMSIPDPEDLRTSRETSNDPSKTAKYEDEFWIVVSLARSLINAAEQDAKEGKPGLTFSTDSGLVAPLYCMIFPSPHTKYDKLTHPPRHMRKMHQQIHPPTSHGASPALPPQRRNVGQSIDDPAGRKFLGTGTQTRGHNAAAGEPAYEHEPSGASRSQRWDAVGVENDRRE